MSSHTPVSSSVIKSTSRFAPKAVPRKQQPAPPPKTPAPTLDDDDSETEDDIDHDPPLDHNTQPPPGVKLLCHDADSTVERSIEGITPIHSSIPVVQPLASTARPQSQPTRSLRSQGPISDPVQPTTDVVSPPTATSSRKRRVPADSAASETSRRNRRKSTPPAAEDVVISPSTMKMSEMCIDKRTGRRSSRYAELREAERQRRRKRELNRDATEPAEPTETPVEIPADEDDTLQPLAVGTTRVMTDAEGHMIVDPSSLQVDRHAIHPSTLTDSLAHTTETIFSSKTNSATYASTRTHASNTIRWFPADNERFYTALQMFGTDFEMIAMFLGGGKQRRHVKNKFYKEEKRNSEKLTWALKNRIEVDVAALEEQRGTKLKTGEEVREELQRLREEARVIMALPRISEMAKARALQEE